MTQTGDTGPVRIRVVRGGRKLTRLGVSTFRNVFVAEVADVDQLAALGVPLDQLLLRWAGTGELGPGGCLGQTARASSVNAVARGSCAGTSVASSLWPRRRFCTKAWPAAIRAADRACFNPRIGRSRSFNPA